MKVSSVVKVSTVLKIVAAVCVTAALVVALVLWRPAIPSNTISSEPPATFPTPGYQFINDDPRLSGDQATPAIEDVNCGGLRGTDLEALLVPSVTPYYFGLTGAETMNCYIRPFQTWVEPGNTPFSVSGRQDWGPSLAYQFPDSFGWGGALWTVWDSSSELFYVPSQPEAADSVQAVLCDSANNCLLVNLFRGGSQNLKPNVNGLVDPIGSALMALEAAWRNLCVEHPELGFAALPDVNPSPYVPITTPVDFGPNTPGGTPTASPSPSSAATPGGGPS